MPTQTPYKVISFDGGGIRGLITAIWLEQIEKRLGKRVGEIVDLVAGTSTGSIIACGVSKGLPASTIVKLYVDKGKDIFPKGARQLWSRFTRTFTEGTSHPRYSDEGLANTLKAEFDENYPFGNLPVPTLVTAYDLLNRSAVVFKSFKDGHKGLPVWEVAKASSSAPTYFPAHVMRIDRADIPLVDGGVVANNPAACALAEAVRLNEEGNTGRTLRDIRLVSFGTGESTRPIEIDDAREWGLLEWAKPAVDVIMDGATDAVSYIVRQILPFNNYGRMQMRLEDAFDDMDDASKTNLNALQAIAKRHLQTEAGSDQFEKMVRLLES